MKKPTTNFNNLDAAKLIQYAEEIIAKMGENNEIFATPTPSLTALEAAVLVYRNSVTEASFNDRRAISFRNEKRKELEFLINELSKYVDTIARGNNTIILSAGFLPSKDPTPGDDWNPKAQQLEVEPQGLGTSRIKAKVKPWKQARYYQFEFKKKNTELPWQKVLSTRSVVEIPNLETFQEYEFRVTYLGKSTEPNYSEVVSTFAL
ncbi:hypothetical protein [Sphingobacterium wenxiniae]|uniref:Fibronectin type-III domain-containing protein n=1 Tax=Sphingobacterium wenxiniae TaxID=683125 RepID=A0A1I6TY20_9SPHI|nr:hypothetical protein [Sphingobacterium wenxiniae]SFS94086.1 hypothetical protein SAMN05660206_107126 [Sphingobacterium wenxiniae]